VRFHTPKITKTREAGHVAQQVEYLCLSKTRPRVQNSSTTTIKKKKKKDRLADWIQKQDPTIGYKKYSTPGKDMIRLKVKDGK
jgi:hypothetical protein